VIFYLNNLGQMVKGAGDSSLRFGMTRRDCGRVGERSGDSLKHIEEETEFRIATSFPHYPK